MTIDHEFSTITFWDPMYSLKTVLKGRILKNERELMKNYLNPNLSWGDKQKVSKIKLK